jgi:guanylate kinase
VERLVILSGPSCVGKGPLCRALGRFHPDLANRLARVVLYNSRQPRPGEVDGEDYHFRRRDFIENLRGKANFSVFDVRGDLQALDLADLKNKLTHGDVLFEGNPFVSAELLDFVGKRSVRSLSVFLSPVSREEILEFKARGQAGSIADTITDMMRRKLLRRTTRHKGILSLADLENIETRAGSAPGELQQAWRYDWVIPNHDGEDSENWDAFYHPVADARQTLLVFVALLEGKVSAVAEKWEQELVRW